MIVRNSRIDCCFFFPKKNSIRFVDCFTETFDEQFRIESMVRKRLQKYQFDSE